MNKELQDLVWSILPKEFKEEVKKLYTDALDASNSPHEPDDRKWGNYRVTLLEKLFGCHNLTSDAEGDEMLMVENGKVQFMFDGLECTRVNDEYDRGYKAGKEFILHGLFGSKCLPDEKVSKSTPLLEPKPAEQRFKVDDIVTIHGFKHPLLVADGAIATILSYHDKGDFYSVALTSNIGIDVDAKYLKPYTKPRGESRNLSQNIANGDKFPNRDLCDKLIRRGFENHNRMHIAAMAMQGLLANTALYEHKVKEWLMCKSNDNPIRFIPMLALKYADALISESNKETNKQPK